MISFTKTGKNGEEIGSGTKISDFRVILALISLRSVADGHVEILSELTFDYYYFNEFIFY